MLNNVQISLQLIQKKFASQVNNEPIIRILPQRIGPKNKKNVIVDSLLLFSEGKIVACAQQKNYFINQSKQLVEQKS